MADDTNITANDAFSALVSGDYGTATEKQNLENIIDAQDQIDIANRNIDNLNAANQQLEQINSESQSAIQQNTALLLDPNVTGADRIRAEANLAADSAVIAQNTQGIQQNNNQIALQQSNIYENELVIDSNSASYKSQTQSGITPDSPADVTPEEDPFEAARLQREQDYNEINPTLGPEDVNPEEDPFEAARLQRQQDYEATSPTEADFDLDSSITRGKTINAQQQNTLQQRVSLPSSADWRVRLSLAPGSTYLYNSGNPGILAPLARTQGVVFPYTPSIETNYVARYDSTDLTHSNYKGYFYKGSHVETVTVRGTFTAQDTREAEYLLAVIHFFRSVTKMFYGATDQLAGVPPPLVFLSGFGQYQFANHPCVVSNFQYSLPSDVDYIRANGFNNFGINLENRRQDTQGSGPPGSGIIGAISRINRLLNSGLVKDIIGDNGSPTAANSNTGPTNSTYVPTKMEISISLYPMQSRSQMSQQFNLGNFANGNLLKGGFW